MSGIGVEVRAEWDPDMRNELGHFTSRVEQGCDEAESLIADQIAELAQAGALASGYAFNVFYHAAGGDVYGEGQFVEMLEFGSPGHPITTDRRGGLVNRNYPGTWRPFFHAPSGEVDHPGTDAKHVLENAGDSMDGVGERILITFLP